MTKQYDTYQDARMANEAGVIVTNGRVFKVGKILKGFENRYFGSDKWEPCHPSEYCITLKQLRDYHGGECQGDVIFGRDISVIKYKDVGVIGLEYIDQKDSTKPKETEIHVLRAKNLPKSKKVKQKRIDSEYVKVDDSIFDLHDKFSLGVLYAKPENCKSHIKIKNTQMLAESLNKRQCYERVETEVSHIDIAIQAVEPYGNEFGTDIINSLNELKITGAKNDTLDTILDIAEIVMAEIVAAEIVAAEINSRR